MAPGVVVMMYVLATHDGERWDVPITKACQGALIEQIFWVEWYIQLEWYQLEWYRGKSRL